MIFTPQSTMKLSSLLLSLVIYSVVLLLLSSIESALSSLSFISHCHRHSNRRESSAFIKTPFRTWIAEPYHPCFQQTKQLLESSPSLSSCLYSSYLSSLSSSRATSSISSSISSYFRNHTAYVHVSIFIPYVTPYEVYSAWVNYTWMQGGGLPAIFTPIPLRGDDIIQNTSYINIRKRRILPIMAEETLYLTELQKQQEQHQRESEELLVVYKVSSLGPIWKYSIEPDSHLGQVSFQPIYSNYTLPRTITNTSNNSRTIISTTTITDQLSNSEVIGTLLSWNVTYNTILTKDQNQNSTSSTFILSEIIDKLWLFTTQNLITQACNNLKSYLAPPIKFVHSTLLPRNTKYKRGTIDSNQLEYPLTPSLLVEKWFDFVWIQGGGLPLPQPYIFTQNKTLSTEDGLEYKIQNWKRMIIPPFLIERIISMNTTTNSSSADDTSNSGIVYYTVDNPSILTYAVHSHLGRVEFISNNPTNETIEMIWEVSIRPMHNCESFVKIFTEMVITTITRNFKVNVLECDPNDQPSMVNVYPPRGGGWFYQLFRNNTDISSSNTEKRIMKPLFQVRKDTWLGNVLDSHLKDGRNVWDQTIDLIKPWRWGTTIVDETTQTKWLYFDNVTELE